MQTAARQEPAYVLHRRPFRETSLLVDLFTLNEGRLSLVARGANGPRSPLKAQLQPFLPLLLDWTGRGELKTLTGVETRQGPQLRGTRSLYSGLYLNELLQRILPVADPHPELFAAYIDALASLAEAGADVEPTLRRFERKFARALGYDFAWDMPTDADLAVKPDAYYCYAPEQGILARSSGGAVLQGLSGESLLGLAKGDLETPACRRTAKQVMRVLIDYLLQGRPLNSRALFSESRGEHNES